MKIITLNIPLGYKIEKKIHNMTVNDAREILLTKKQKKFTSAIRSEYDVSLAEHFITCPHCGNKVNLYAKNLKKAFNIQAFSPYRLKKEVILDWTSQQIDLFKETYKPLLLNHMIKVNDELSCPKCKNTMKPSEETRKVEIRYHRHKLFIRAEVLDVTELFSLPCLTGGSVYIEFPLYEVACFNFIKGHTYLRLENAKGQCIAIRDITSDKYNWFSGTVYNVISKNKQVKRILRDLFNREWNGKIPFFPSELNVNELRMLTMFVGYDRNFYSSIPFKKDSLGVEESFIRQVKKMHHSRDTVKLFKNSNLPDMKSVRKIFFSDAGLFFYLEECERFWNLLNDPNYFTALLKNEEIYRILSDLHTRPMIFEFIEDFLKIFKAKRLLKLINKRWQSLCTYAVNYGSMSEHMRKGEREKWKQNKKGSGIDSVPDFSIPMIKEPAQRIRNCVIDEFEFSWLKTSTDYKEAGEALNNCLTEWERENYPVVCVRKGGKIIAAMEIRDDFVYQAYTANNCSLSKEPGLINAYYKWHFKNNLSENYRPHRRRLHHVPMLFHNDFDFENDDLPF